MAVSDDFLNYILDQLSEVEGVTSKRMFGGVGVFRDGRMFGMIAGDTFRLKVDKHNQADYEARGMQPLFMKNKKKGMPYWEVPADVLEDKTQLKAWAEKAYQAAMRSKKK